MNIPEAELLMLCEQAEQVSCGYCHALAGQPCTWTAIDGTVNTMRAPHPLRIKATTPQETNQ